MLGDVYLAIQFYHGLVCLGHACDGGDALCAHDVHYDGLCDDGGDVAPHVRALKMYK